MIVEKKKTKAYTFGYGLGKVQHYTKLYFRKTFDAFFDAIDWDVKHAYISLLVGLFLLLAGGGIPDLFSWKYWAFFIGSMIIFASSYRKGSIVGSDIVKKFYEENYVLIPKKELIRQAEMQEQMQRHIAEKKRKKDKEKLSN